MMQKRMNSARLLTICNRRGRYEHGLSVRGAILSKRVSFNSCQVMRRPSRLPVQSINPFAREIDPLLASSRVMGSLGRIGASGVTIFSAVTLSWSISDNTMQYACFNLWTILSSSRVNRTLDVYIHGTSEVLLYPFINDFQNDKNCTVFCSILNVHERNANIHDFFILPAPSCWKALGPPFVGIALVCCQLAQYRRAQTPLPPHLLVLPQHQTQEARLMPQHRVIRQEAG